MVDSIALAREQLLIVVIYHLLITTECIIINIVSTVDETDAVIKIMLWLLAKIHSFIHIHVLIIIDINVYPIFIRLLIIIDINIYPKLIVFSISHIII